MKLLEDEEDINDHEQVQEQPEQDPIQLRDYQETAVAWMLERFKDKEYRGCMLADDMGTGKTGMFCLFCTYIKSPLKNKQLSNTA